MRALYKSGLLFLFFLWAWLPCSVAVAASVAVFPLQELGEGRNDANLPLTRLLTEQLVANGNEVISLKTVITFMANNRIRTLGHLESYHISRVRSDLGAAFILLGTVSQRRERPEPSLGLTLNLIRTSDGRTVWTFVDSVSVSDARRPLAIGEPRTVDDLQPLLLAGITEKWPWPIINEVQRGGAINIDLARVQPSQVRPGDNLYCQVRLRQSWPEGEAPRIFFQVNEQLYPATLAADGRSWEGSWVAGQTDGKYPVLLLLEWSLYGRTETALLGSYLVDGKPPLLEIELHGGQQLDGRQVFSQAITIVPRQLVRKHLSRWRLSFYGEEGNAIGEMGEEGNLPESFVWAGRSTDGRVEDGFYKVALEVWDQSGNSSRAEKRLEVNRSMPRVALAVDSNEHGVYVDLADEGKVPLEYWRMEMWTREGRILARQEGDELPIRIDLDMAGAELNEDIQGFVYAQNVLGNRSRLTLQELLPELGKDKAVKVEEAPGLSEKWVEEF